MSPHRLCSLSPRLSGRWQPPLHGGRPAGQPLGLGPNPCAPPKKHPPSLTLCSCCTTSASFSLPPSPMLNHSSNFSLLENTSGSKKLSSAHSSCRLFCWGWAYARGCGWGGEKHGSRVDNNSTCSVSRRTLQRQQQQQPGHTHAESCTHTAQATTKSCRRAKIHPQQTNKSNICVNTWVA